MTTSKELSSKGKFIALHFLLKTECPYCIRHTSEYFEKALNLNLDKIKTKILDKEDLIQFKTDKIK